MESLLARPPVITPLPDPSGLSGLVLWLDAATLSTLWTTSARSVQVASDADPVGAWDDRSASANHFLQATAGKRATYKTAQQNGLPCLRFASASSQTLVGSEFMAGITNPSFFVVWKHTAAVLQGVYCDTGNTGAAVARLVLFGSAGNLDRFDLRDSANITLSSGTLGKADNVWHITFFTLIGTDTYLFGNGVPAVTPSGIVASNVSYLTTQTYELGTAPEIGAFQASSFLDGDIGEIIVYNRALLMLERRRVWGYLRRKWLLGPAA